MPLASDTSSLLLELEHKHLRALVECNMEVAAALHADDYQLITPEGAVLSKEDYMAGVASGALDYLIFEAASKVLVRAFENVGMDRYQARIEIDFSGGHDAGCSGTPTLTNAETDTGRQSGPKPPGFELGISVWARSTISRSGCAKGTRSIRHATSDCHGRCSAAILASSSDRFSPAYKLKNLAAGRPPLSDSVPRLGTY